MRPSRTHRRLHPIRYHIPLLACSHCLLFDALERPSSTTASESAFGIPIRHLRTTGCALVCATAADAVDGRTGSAMVGGTWHSWLGFGGNGWVVPISVACILACFIIAASTLALLVLYIRSSDRPPLPWANHRPRFSMRPTRATKKTTKPDKSQPKSSR